MPDVKAALTKKIGPVPVVVLVAGAAAAFAILSRRGAKGGDSFIPTGNAGDNGGDALGNITDELGNLVPYDPILGSSGFPVEGNFPSDGFSYVPNSGSENTTTKVVALSSASSTGDAAKSGSNWYDFLVNAFTGVRDPGVPAGYGYQASGRYLAAIDPNTGLPLTTAPDFVDYGIASVPGSTMTQGMTIEDWYAQSAEGIANDPVVIARIEAEKSQVAEGQLATGVGPGGVPIYGPREEDLLHYAKDIVVVPTSADDTLPAFTSDNGGVVAYEPIYQRQSTAETDAVDSTTASILGNVSPTPVTATGRGSGFDYWYDVYLPSLTQGSSSTATKAAGTTAVVGTTNVDTTPVEGPRDTGRPATTTINYNTDLYQNAPYQSPIDAPVDF